MRVLPLMEHRMLLWSYKEPPDVRVQINVRTPLIGERRLPLTERLSFIKSSFTAAIQDSLVEPRRAAYPLDYQYSVQQVGSPSLFLPPALSPPALFLLSPCSLSPADISSCHLAEHHPAGGAL